MYRMRKIRGERYAEAQLRNQLRKASCERNDCQRSFVNPVEEEDVDIEAR